MQKCLEIEKIDEINGTDLLKVKIQNDAGDTTTAYWFYDLSNALAYLDQPVIVDYRQEIIKGNLEYTINTFTVPTQINTLTQAENIRLYADAVDNFATVSFNDLSVDEEIPNACVYCIKQEIRSSEKALWIDYTIRDKNFHIGHLRLFDYDTSKFDYTGSYIMVTPFTKSKYGFSCSAVTKATGEVPANPEITIAKQYIQNFFSDNEKALSALTHFNLFSHFEHQIDYEPAYGIVRLATELALTQQLTNITDSLNTIALQEAMVASHLYVAQPNTILSKDVCNILLASKHDWTDKSLVIRIIDVSDDAPAERKVFTMIKDLADTIIRNRKEVTCT